jgi:hypothetical protein
MFTGVGVERGPLATAGERIVRILKREHFEDHWQALMPDCERPTPRGAMVDQGSPRGGA